MRKTSYFGYVQDEFKLRPNLTINAGLRYEFYNDFHEITGRAIPFDFQTCGGFCGAECAIPFPAKNNYRSPLGLAWAPEVFNGRTVSATGYGFYHEDAQLDDQNFPTANDEPRYSLARGTQFPNLTYPFDSLLATATGVLSPKDQLREPEGHLRPAVDRFDPASAAHEIDRHYLRDRQQGYEHHEPVLH